MNDRWVEETRRRESERIRSLTWLIRLSRGLPSEPTRQVRSCGIHANHWMGGTPMQYLSTASARVFLSSKLRSHNTYRQRGKQRKATVRRAGRNKAQNKLYTLVILPRCSFNYSIHNKAAVVRVHTARGAACPLLIIALLLLI